MTGLRLASAVTLVLAVTSERPDRDHRRGGPVLVPVLMLFAGSATRDEDHRHRYRGAVADSSPPALPAGGAARSGPGRSRLVRRLTGRSAAAAMTPRTATAAEMRKTVPVASPYAAWMIA
jgi:hypothetical protein